MQSRDEDSDKRRCLVGEEWVAVLGAARRGVSLELDVSGGDRTEVDRAGKAGAMARRDGWREVVLQKKT